MITSLGGFSTPIKFAIPTLTPSVPRIDLRIRACEVSDRISLTGPYKRIGASDSRQGEGFCPLRGSLRILAGDFSRLCILFSEVPYTLQV